MGEPSAKDAMRVDQVNLVSQPYQLRPKPTTQRTSLAPVNELQANKT
jgi:hypothetical protein